MTLPPSSTSSSFRRFLLPGFAFKAVVIGGGYATGRELVEFFFPAGPRGGLFGLLFTAALWSLVCTCTFLFAREAGSRDYRSFFHALLGRFWFLFEGAYLALMVLILSVFGAAAGEIFRSAFGLPALAGTAGLAICIALVATFGNESVERLFKYVSFFLYATYALFVVLVLARFGGEVAGALALDVSPDGWLRGGLTYAGYNLVGAVVILPVTRHLTSRRDAVVAGMLCGPLAALPALLFFLCMLAFYPAIGEASLPSDAMLTRLGLPLFHILFQLMIFAALLESGTGLVHAFNERVAAACTTFPGWMRLAASSALLVLSIFLAVRIGLVELIASGYSASAYLFLAIYVVPLLAVMLWRSVRGTGRT